ncbi:basic amino acid ABC transporter substrate-binding protein [uncultured Veillonella sp.]|uniref:basic amino acid ABC transporter substrate-binding protein n=1 Tax=uncultured Veillonella sp. TaxID=159268 RepID=UPI00262243C2|nr:basic amino acid ABC transporter substrate-binding protein [uncultured Veillonella sp.]
MFSNLKKFASKRVVLGVTAALLAVGLLAGCGNDSAQQGEKVLRVGAETTFPPFEFTEGDKYVGFDIDLAEAIAKKMGYKMEFKSMGFDALIPALQSNDIDMIASGINATPERAKAVDFSEPYFTEGGFAIVVRKDNTTINDWKDLEGKRIITQIGTIPSEMARKIDGAQVKDVDSNSQAFNELQANTADAMILDNAVAMYYLKQGADKDLKITGQPTQAEGTVWAFRKGDNELREKANKALQDLKADGTYQKIYDKWFGSSQK